MTTTRDVTTPCREWTGATAKGYGVISVTSDQALVHRVAWQLHHNSSFVDDRKGSVVMHLCNNPLCYRISHLRSGTQSENMRHWLATSGSGAHKLTEADVALIKRALLNGEHPQSLANQFGCTPGNIYNIQAGRSWGWVKPAN